MKATIADNPVSIREEIEEYEKAKARYRVDSPQYRLFEKEIEILKKRLVANA